MRDSIYLTVLKATKAKLAALDMGNVKLRKRAFLLQEDTLPCLVVSPVLSDGEKIAFETFGRIAYSYPVSITLFDSGSELSETKLAEWLSKRERVRDECAKPTLVGAATVFNSEAISNPAYEIVGGPTRAYDVAAWVINYHSDEVRPTV